MNQKINFNFFEKSLKRDWYVQGFNGVPIFLNLAAYSGISMKKILGYGYKSFAHNYSNDGYGEMYYLNSDFKKLWAIIKNKIAKSPDYLIGLRKRYGQIFSEHEKMFREIKKSDLKKINDKKLFEIFKQCAAAQIDSVGIAHIVETIGIEIEREFKARLFNELKDKTGFHNLFARLVTPTKSSFIAKEEMELKKIYLLPIYKRKKALEKHLEKYFWVQNSYAGAQKITIKTIRQRMESLKKQKINSAVPKAKLIKNLKLTKETREMIKIIDFIIIWQDERKANTLKTISYFESVIKEISRRTRISEKLLYYLGIGDIQRMKSFKDFQRFRKSLQERIKGVYFLTDGPREYSLSGKSYRKLIKIKKRITKQTTLKENIIHGTIACAGTVIGRAVICKNLNSLEKVHEGDIIVASMTRPEFAPAIKKAAGIITDEGGVTCHAAIIAREFNIPAVIGTRVATKLLKDGMLVEIRANHGLVKILESN